ncbi:putative Zn-finger domain protein [Leptomonas seymouri]|uniref:Putative Zn-finger domain protein n=1 Tax=Leptomonas seymouri TaxID=5684 RepID=A0A0N0P944_LEPSE|nr:putative Zn-finger domain protein [Leptomonas seymouri]|eukprot:KPI90686.1 putative Zn-finger domain protein [Leptomonas seymouri]
MEAASSTSAHGVEDVRADGNDLDAPLPSLPHLSSPLDPSYDSSCTLSPLNLGRQMECWICFGTLSTPANPIVTHRCRCRGSVGFVHEKCINKWVIQERNLACHICGAEYRLVYMDVPPGADLPIGPRERKAFLVKFLVLPLLKELAETILCLYLRFIFVPVILGVVYNYHLITVLLWTENRRTIWLMSCVSSAFNHPLLLWLFNIDIVAASNTEMNYIVYLSAVTNTFLFGLVLCTVMSSVMMASRNWNKYFKHARRQHGREAAALAQRPAQQQQATTAMTEGERLQNNTGTSGQTAATATATERVAAVEELLERQQQSLPHPVLPGPHVESQRPEMERMQMGTRFEQRADTGKTGKSEADREDMDGFEEVVGAAEGARTTSDESNAAGSDDSGDDTEDDDSSSSGSRTPLRVTFVDEVFDMIDWVKCKVGGGGLQRLLPSLWLQLRYGVVVTLLLRCPLGWMVIAVGCVVLIFGWHWRYPRNVLKSPKRRYQEVAERVPLLSPEAVQTLFYTYLVDAFLFYGALPVMGGATFHCALSPYFNIGMDGGLLNFLLGLTVWKITVYWGIGALLVMLLTAMELTVVSALFANGVELFFVRSFDARWDAVLGYWRCVITQVFDLDPSRIVCGFARVATVELLVLFVFLRLPFWGMCGVRDLVWGDGMTSIGRSSDVSSLLAPRESKRAYNSGVDSVLKVNQDLTFAEWRHVKALQLFDEKVLLPFGELYVEMIGSHPSLLGDSNTTAPLHMEPIVKATVLETNSTPAEMLAQVWGNMSDTAVFTFNLIDPSSAARVAELSEGFRDTLARVRTPREWMRQATLHSSVCDTLTALSSPAELSKDATLRLPTVNIEGLLKPPEEFLSHPSMSAARNRQMIFEAWQLAHSQAVGHLVGLSPGSVEGSVRELYEDVLQRWPPRTHAVNVVHCYVMAMQVTQPFVRMGSWLNTVMEWWSMLLIRNILLSHCVISLLYCLSFFTVIVCFGVFPVQRAQLRLLLPFVQWLGRHVVHMEDYLFDPELTRAVEDFVSVELDEELVPPPMVEPLSFNRREDYIDESLIPSHPLLRRVVVSVLFFTAASLMVWTVPVLCGSLLLSLTSNSISVLLGATLMSFFIWSPSLLGRSALYGTGLFLTFCFGAPVLIGMNIISILKTFWKHYPCLVQETFERHYNVYQKVGTFEERDGERQHSSSIGSNNQQDENHAHDAETEDDEWESVTSSEVAPKDETEGGRQRQEEEEEEGEELEREGLADGNGGTPAAASN